MKTQREIILDRLREAKPAILRQFPVRRMALFGSIARGEGTAESDVDILVDVDPSIGLGFVTLAEQLELLLGQQVDLVSLRAVRPLLWRQIEPELIDV